MPGLGGYLHGRGFKRLFLAALATDYCVFYSALDARRGGFEVVLLQQACRAIDFDGSLAASLAAMQGSGVELLQRAGFSTSGPLTRSASRASAYRAGATFTG
ncbi:isochorismatase family protein [Pseudomonas boanensis]|uniref:isochorismatase family protein n=1 Tax=Metapseudomonas boanensis TaxID=2822138 RepID=UPI0035D48CE0